MISTVHDMRPGEIFSPIAQPNIALALLTAEGLPVADGTRELWTVVVDIQANTPAVSSPGQLRKFARSEPVRRLALRSPAVYEAA